MRIKKGDTVLVTRGRDKGRLGKVLEVFPRQAKVLVENVNKVTKHKKQSASQKTAGRFEETHPIDISKLAYPHPSKKGRGTRIGYKLSAKGDKKRLMKSNGKEI